MLQYDVVLPLYSTMTIRTILPIGVPRSPLAPVTDSESRNDRNLGMTVSKIGPVLDFFSTSPKTWTAFFLSLSAQPIQSLATGLIPVTATLEMLVAPELIHH